MSQHKITHKNQNFTSWKTLYKERAIFWPEQEQDEMPEDP